jgi:hypothetical protein
MATTTNYGWTTPDDTDLVKDGAAAIRTLGSSVDTTTKNLNPETTTGDIAYRSATANTNTRLALGTAGQVLTVNSGATAPEWASVASKFVQIVSTQTGAVATGTNTIPLDDSIPQSSEGDQYMSVSITPTSATNKLFIQVVTNTSADSIKTNTAALFVDSTANALAAVSNTTRSGGDLLIVSFNHNMTAGSTSAMTFKVRIGTDSGGTLTFNGSGGNRRYGGVIASSITITEYTP